jgi:NAD(P)-dependent dehydrogenase (short-subunit alcohol dehydrogenase family)
MGVQGDVSNIADLDRLYDTVKQQKGWIDVLFANAGTVELAPLGSITESHFHKIFSINVKGYSLYKKRFRCFKMVALSF